MDYYNNCVTETLQFLDLSDVDNIERNQILSTLENDGHANRHFPWFIGQINNNYNEVTPESTAYYDTTIPALPNDDQIYYPSTVLNHAAEVSSPDVYFNNNEANNTAKYYNYSTAVNDADGATLETKHLNSSTDEEVLENHTDTPIKTAENTVKAGWGGAKRWADLFAGSKSNSNTVSENYAENVVNNNGAVNNESNNSDHNTVYPGNNYDGNHRQNTNRFCPIKNPKKATFVDPDCYRMGEFLCSYVLDGKTISLQPKGLINQSNYCYINSILQALIACPPVYNLLSGLSQNISSNEKRKPTPVIDGMCRFIKEFKHLPASMRVNRRQDVKSQKKDQNNSNQMIINTDIPFEPSWIYKMLNGIRTDLIEGRQEDAEEFLGCLLNNLNDEMLELMKLVSNSEINKQTDQRMEHCNKDVDDDVEDKEWQVMGPKNKAGVTRRTELERTPISDIFGGFLRSRIHKTGDHITENIQPFFTLQLNIEKVKTVREALESLTSKYKLEGVTSSRTNEEVEAWQQVMLDELPVILVLHLKCFDFKLNGCTKIIKALEFPIDLKIESKLLSNKNTTTKEKQYKLFAVVYHDGKEASKGHYVTDAFHVGYSSWLRYDDASVKPVQEEQVLKPAGTRVPYLLFYRRSDTIRSK